MQFLAQRKATKYQRRKPSQPTMQCRRYRSNGSATVLQYLLAGYYFDL